MLTDAIVLANVSDVAESPEQQIENIDKDIYKFTERYKKFRTYNEEILMRAIERDTDKVSQEVVQINQSSGIKGSSAFTDLKLKFLEKNNHNDRGESMDKAIDKLYKYGV